MDGLTIFALVLLVSCPLLVGVGWLWSQSRGLPGIEASPPGTDDDLE
jgi:hypothetical protein